MNAIWTLHPSTSAVVDAALRGKGRSAALGVLLLVAMPSPRRKTMHDTHLAEPRLQKASFSDPLGGLTLLPRARENNLLDPVHG